MFKNVEQTKASIVLPPNKQMDVNFDFSESPIFYEYLMFLDFSEAGSSILGSSAISGTFWEGTLLYFKDEENLENYNHSKYYVHMTVTDGKFINEEMVVVAEDTGVLSYLSIDNGHKMMPMNYFRHPRKISEIGVWSKSSNVLTCSGRTVANWDVNSNDKRPLFISENVHLDEINSVHPIKTETNLFVSASSDRKACLWDMRGEEFPTVIYNNEFSALTKATVNPNNTNYIAIGTHAGDVYLVDKREPGNFVSMVHCFNQKVSCLTFNSINQLGVSGDISEVAIHTCTGNKFKEIYRNKEHRGHVKDLKWFENSLYSCGFGEKKLVKHVMKELP